MANPPVCSAPVSGKPGSCLRRFIVHFRRPSDYSGQYGFDWLREEHIKPLTNINGSMQRICSSNLTDLQTKYLEHVKNPISPYGQRYYPAWLAIFAYIPNSKNQNISDMTKNGAQLDLRIDEIDPIVQDGTEIIFKPGNSNLKITPEKISITEVISSGKKSKGSLNYYHLKRKINVKCHGGFLNTHEEIKVIARLGGTEEEVGKLMVYNNSKVPHTDIVIVDVITDTKNGQPISAKQHQYYEWLIKKKAFNQALIRAEVKVEATFDLTKLSAETDVQTFLNRNFANERGAVFARELRTLYNKYGPYKVSGGIDGPRNSDKTFMFLTNKQTLAGGVCTLDGSIWGDMVILFKSNLTHDHSLPHELGHSYSLPHAFQATSTFSPYPSFHRGYSENYMDYQTTDDGKRNPFHPIKTPGVFTFYKWQWDVIRGDKSMR